MGSMDNDKHRGAKDIIFTLMVQGRRRRQMAYSKRIVDGGIYPLDDKGTLIGVEWKWEGEHDKNN